MAFPFGGHPTLGMFVEAAQQHGCGISRVVRADRDGQPFTVLQIDNPHGGSIAIVDPEMDERLVPSIVGNYQRRLGIRTSFAALPPDPPEATVTADDAAEEDGA